VWPPALKEVGAEGHAKDGAELGHGNYVGGLFSWDACMVSIIITHIPKNEAAASAHVCPGIRIHAIDIVQPPGIGIPGIADMDAHQTIVSAKLVAKSNAKTPTKARSEVRSEAIPGSMLRQIRDSKLLAREVV
jgi:hypothetical protein